MKILFATDCSEISLYALRNAMKWLKPCVIDVICVSGWSFIPQEVDFKDSVCKFLGDNVIEKVMCLIEEEMADAGFEFGEKIMTDGNPSEKIIEQALKTYYDMILLGSNGKKGLKKWLGSTSYHIVYNTKTPSLTVKKSNNHQKVLFTVDNSEFAAEIAEAALNLLDLKHHEIHIRSVFERQDLFFTDVPLDVQMVEQIEAGCKAALERSVEDVKSTVEQAGFKIASSDMLNGNPAETIINFAREREIDLIVMGNNSQRHFSGLLTTSVSRRVLENVLSDVLLIKY